VLAVATLKDCAEELRYKKESDETKELLLEVQAQLISRLRLCHLPTSADLYSAEEAASVMDRWELESQNAHTDAARIMKDYLADVRDVLQRLEVEDVQRSPVVDTQTPEEIQAATITQLRALLAQLEEGAFAVREVRTTPRGWLEEIIIQGRRESTERRES
jgi:virulence-associated protein VapD